MLRRIYVERIYSSIAQNLKLERGEQTQIFASTATPKKINTLAVIFSYPCRSRWFIFYEAGSTPKIEFLLQQVDCGIDRLCRIGFRVVESNFIKQIQNSCYRIKFHILFVSFRRIEFLSVDLYLYQATFVSANWNGPFFLSFWSSFSQFFQHFLKLFCRDLSFF